MHQKKLPTNKQYMYKPLLHVFLDLWLLFPLKSFQQDNKKLDSLLNIYHAQNEDSLKANVINHIIQIELYNRPEKVKTYIYELIALSKSINYKKGEARGYHRCGGYHFNRGAIDSAIIYFKKSQHINEIQNDITGIIGDNTQLALAYLNQNKFKIAHEYLDKNINLYNARDTLKPNPHFKFIGSTFHTKADAYIRQSMYKLALENELKALKLYESTNDDLYVADALNSLGNIENNLGNYKQSLAYLERAYDTYKKNNDVFFQATALVNLGITSKNLKQYDKAVSFFKEGIDIAQNKGFKDREALLWSNLGSTYETMGKLDDAIQCQNKSIALSSSLGNDTNYPYAYLGSLYRKTKDFSKSMFYLDKVIEKAENTGLLKLKGIGYMHRAKLNEDLKDYNKALQDYKAYKTINDSIFNTTKARQIEELRTIYETEKKEQQIALQKNQIDLLKKKREINLLYNMLLALALLLSLIGFYALRQKLKRSKAEREKLNLELDFKMKELTTHALHLAKKNEVLENLKQQAKTYKEDTNAQKGFNQLIRTINFDLKDDNNWENFARYFGQVHKDFNITLKQQFPELTSNELRLMALLKMNLSSKEIANILNISQEGIKKARYRLRKKLGITSEDSLQDLVLNL